MDTQTIEHLNTISRDFYALTAEEFSETRSKPWPGWRILLPYLNFEARGQPYSVLDVGCGNGRFGAFLAEYLEAPVIYHGVDNNPALLAHAGTALQTMTNIATRLEQRDVVISPPDTGEYDLVVLFGLIHHIPGAAHRQDLMAQMAQRVKSGGFLAFACWRFYEHKRFQQRIIPWPEALAGQVEWHDYLLDWRRGEAATDQEPRRYCHYVDNDEHAALIDASGLEEIHTFRADGFTNTFNRYSLLKRA